MCAVVATALVYRQTHRWSLTRPCVRDAAELAEGWDANAHVGSRPGSRPDLVVGDRPGVSDEIVARLLSGGFLLEAEIPCGS
jgi:hypothetical protein